MIFRNTNFFLFKRQLVYVSRMVTFKVEENHKTRLDQFLVEKIPNVSRSYIQRLIKNKKVLLNDLLPKQNEKVKDNDLITVDLDQKINSFDKVDINVIYEDKDCIVVNKPSGMLSHSKGSVNEEFTIADFIGPKLSGYNQTNRSGIVHRLDRGTSGVMICAKTPTTMIWLQKQFSSRRVTKNYKAIISGRLKESEAILNLPIERNPKVPSTFRVGLQGKVATTTYKEIKTNDRYSLIELIPKTGRTHQLRVHLGYIGHPIVGDMLYGGNKADRLYLHAESLEIKLLNGEIHKFIAKLPSSFNKYLKNNG